MKLCLSHISEQLSIQNVPPLFSYLEPWADGTLAHSQQDQVINHKRGKLRKPIFDTGSMHLGRTHNGKTNLLQRRILGAHPGKETATSEVCRHTGNCTMTQTSAGDIGLLRGVELSTKHSEGRGQSV